MGHVWNGPGFKGDVTRFGGGTNAVMCPAFFAASWPLAQMGSANGIQTILRHRCASDPYWIVAVRRSTDRHLVYRSCLLGTGSRLGCYRLPPVDLITRHHRPHNAGDLVRQSNGRNLARPALQQLQKPGTRRLAAGLGEANHRHCADDQ
jgi:hypothetical protein